MAPKNKYARLSGALAVILFAILLMGGLAHLATRRPERAVPVGRPDRIELVQVLPNGKGWLLLTFVTKEGAMAVAVEDAVLEVRLLPSDDRRALDEVARFETRVGPAHWRSVSPEDTRFDVDIPCNLSHPFPPGTRTVEARVKLSFGGQALEGSTHFIPDER